MSDVWEEITVESAKQAVLNCLDACASDEGEPERYARWYAATAKAIRDGRIGLTTVSKAAQ